jgi:hypothetical protein
MLPQPIEQASSVSTLLRMKDRQSQLGGGFGVRCRSRLLNEIKIHQTRVGFAKAAEISCDQFLQHIPSPWSISDESIFAIAVYGAL